MPHPASGGAPGGRRDPTLPPDSDGPSLQDVLKAALEAVASARAAASFRSTDLHNITVEDQMHWIAAKVSTLPILKAVSTTGWFDEQPTPVARIALLLALLELARQGFILLYQAEDFTAILVKALREVPADLQPVDETEGLPLTLT
jgi:chromatin segregation and condensation protein Rec8/ScpA/Scc1 (kleisin family)